MHISTHNWPWFAIVVRMGEEKSAALLLENSGYECFLPLSNVDRQISDRSQAIALPLFPGYLFCRMNPHNRVPVLRTPGVIQIVGEGRTLIPVEEDEIAAMQRVGKSTLPTMPWPYLRVGRVAQMENGPLRGLSGIVVKVKFGMRLVLSVNLLRRSMSVEIDRRWISSSHPARLDANHVHACRPAPPALDINLPEITPGRQ
jgi:transcription antitermination factor NusG